MKTRTSIWLAAVLSWTLASAVVQAQDKGERPPASRPADKETAKPKESPLEAAKPPVKVDGSVLPIKRPDSKPDKAEPAKPDRPEKPEPPQRPDRKEKPEKPEKPERPEKPEPLSLRDQVNKLIDQFKSARDEFLSREKELQRRFAEAAKDARDQIRSEIAETRVEFLEVQKLAGEEIRKRLEELKDELSHHRDIIEEAKEDAKEKLKQRRGDGD